MAGIRFPRLVENFIVNLERQGESVVLEAAVATRPGRLRVAGRSYLLFLWSVTPGGGPPGTRPGNERRIQLTKLTGIPLVPGRRTLIGGWSEEVGVYSFWDARRHVRFSQKSPSLQVNLLTLQAAEYDGIATQRRPTREGYEVVVAVHPDSLAWYVLQGEALHNAAEDANEIASLINAQPEEERAFLDEAPTESAVDRRYELIQTLRAFRASRFRPAVLRAYSCRCAICGVSLKLVDTAHIVPLAYPGSTDEVTNGIALCKLHHAAFDNGLIGVQPDYRVVLNENLADRLRASGLSSGLEDFRENLPDAIRLPSSQEVRPTPANLRLGMAARGWPNPT